LRPHQKLLTKVLVLGAEINIDPQGIFRMRVGKSIDSRWDRANSGRAAGSGYAKRPKRLEDELGEEQDMFIRGLPDWDQLPDQVAPLIVGIDGGYVCKRPAVASQKMVRG
jgi:hypothetical protein